MKLPSALGFALLGLLRQRQQSGYDLRKTFVETAMRHSPDPKREIIHYAREIQPDLLVMGAHGHGSLKDLIFGNTIDPVRHALDIPILVVREARRGRKR